MWSAVDPTCSTRAGTRRQLNAFAPAFTLAPAADIVAADGCECERAAARRCAHERRNSRGEARAPAIEQRRRTRAVDLPKHRHAGRISRFPSGRPGIKL